MNKGGRTSTGLMCNLFCLVLMGIFIPLTSHAAAKTDAKGWIDFELTDGKVGLPVEVLGEEGKLLVDTGSGFNYINKTLLERHPDKATSKASIWLEGEYGRERQKVYSRLSLKLLGETLEMREIVGANLADELVIFGRDFFLGRIIQIDYPNTRLRISKQSAMDVKKSENINMRVTRQWSTLGSTRRQSENDKKRALYAIPLVEVNLNGEKKVWLKLDTGFSGGIELRRSVATEMGWLDKFALTDEVLRGKNTTAKYQRFTLPVLGFGPYELGNIPVSVRAEGQGIRDFSTRDAGEGSNLKRQKFSGRIGYEVFKHFVLTLDLEGGDLHIGLPER